jgi:hypothetical protein
MNAQEFEFAPPGKFARIFPLAIGVLAPLAIIAALAATAAPVPWLAVLPALMALPVVAGVLAWAMYRRRIRVRDQFIAYGLFPWRRCAIAALNLDAARVFDLEAERDWQPVLKLAGSRLPGYCAGWFWLRNRRRAYVVLTEWRRVLMLPKRDGGLILLSAQRPDALLEALRRVPG